MADNEDIDEESIYWVLQERGPVGFVELQTGEEILKDKAAMILRMAINALAGVNLTLFPIVFIYIMMG